MNTLPAEMNVAHARLPAAYEAAKTALANCVSLDECQEWANKAEALASYARQAEDDTLRKHADRIQARAVRRAGEMLKTFNSQGARNDTLPDGAVHKSQYEAGHSAGMGERQIKTAVRVASVPAEEFERAVDSEKPPTVTKLAEMGTKHRERPEGFHQATHLIGTVKRFAEFCEENDATTVANGVMPYEARDIREMVSTIDGWLDRFVVNLKD